MVYHHSDTFIITNAFPQRTVELTSLSLTYYLIEFSFKSLEKMNNKPWKNSVLI